MASPAQQSELLNIQLLVDSIPALIHTARPDGYLDYFNKPWLEYLGATLDDVTGWKWRAFVHPEDVEGIVAKWRACLATGEIFEYETRVRRASGEYRWMFHRKVPLRDSNGNIVKWYGSSLDIEDRKTAEEKIRAQQRHFRDVIDTIPAMVWTALPDGSIDFCNERWRSYTGLTLEEIQGDGWQRILHPDDQERVLAAWHRSVAEGIPFEQEERGRGVDGTYRWFLARGVPLRDEHRDILTWYGTLTDIEDRKRAEEAQRCNEFYLAEGQRLAHLGSWAFDPDGFDYWSPELFRMYGLDEANKPPSVQEYLNCVHPQDRESMADLIKRSLAEAAPFDATKRIVRPDGEVRYIRCVGVPLVGNQSLKKYVGSALDVTDHDLLTQELRRREAYLTGAQRLSHTGSFGWRLDDGETVWSDETYRIFEYDSTLKPTLDSVVQRVHPDDRALVQQVIDRASQSGTDFEHEYRLLMADGRVKHVHAIAHAVQNATGNRECIGAVTDLTERRRMEELLGETEARFRIMADSAPVAVWMSGTDAKCDFFNQGWLNFTGRTLEQEFGDGWAEGVHPLDLQRCMDTYIDAFNRRQEFKMEYRLRRFDGEYRWILDHGAPRYTPRGEFAGFIGSCMDITERKQAEEALQCSEAYLAEAQRLSQTGSWAWSPDHDIRYWSEECYRVLSFDPQDGLPRFEEFFQRIHPDDQPRLRELIQTAIREKAEWEADYRIVHPGGPVRDIHVLGHPVLSTSGHLVEFVGTVIDVTERKRAEEELRRSEMELRQMLDLAPQHVAVFGAGRERLCANRILLDYLGLTLEEWRQRFDRDEFVHADDWERVKGHFDRALSTGAGFELELRLRKGDGSYRWFLARYNPVRDDKGQIIRWYVAATDIEDRKQAEDRLRRENVALREEIGQASMFEDIVGTSPALKAVLSNISKVAPSDSTVLITGETGTGKELVARAIHKHSQRSSHAFISVNCAAIPRDLIASELFGHEKGAFTGATQQRLGRFELARGGTLFLDEVGELPAETQIALLRVLQEHEFERVGGTRRIHADVRVIAATNRDLQAAIGSGSFRSDLFYRLNVFPIEIPSLRERRADIPSLVEYFIDLYARKAGKNIKRINKKTLELLQSYPWPGNVRELQNVIERSVILCETDIFSIDESWLPQQPLPATEPKHPIELPRRLLTQEKDMIEAALKESRGRVFGPAGAAAKLGIPRSTLESKIKSLNIDKNRFRTHPET